MNIHYGIDELKYLQNPVITMGIFDGVHLGHKQILDVLTTRAHQLGCQSLVITFNPHPRIILQKDHENLKLITSLEERMERLSRCEIDHLLILPFTTELASLSSEEFIKSHVHEPFHPSLFIVGYDHQFGRHGEGNFHLLRTMGDRLGFDVEQVSAFQIGNMPVSSSRIRENLFMGNVEEAKNLLGYPYYIFGKVVEGNKVGRKIGYPTANIQPTDSHKLIPSMGVYAATAQVRGRKYKGMMNIGYRPTLNRTELTIEINLFDFDGDLYGQEIKACLHSWMREEMKFPSIDALQAQLDLDKENAERSLMDELID